MPKVSELYEFLDKKFPRSYSCAWDNDGLMVCGDLNREVVRVLCTLDVTDEAIDYAVNGDFDVIVSHHPLIFKPLRGVNPADPTARRVLRCLEKGITVMSFHTRLDAAPGGLNDIFAKLLGLTDVTVLEADGESVGRIGTLPEAVSPAEFAANVKKALKAERVRYAQAEPVVRRVAVCGGAGDDYLPEVAAAGYDTYVTGDVKYNDFWDAVDLGVNLIDAGHFPTENPVCAVLARAIAEAFPEVEVRLSQRHRDIIRFG